VIPGRSFISILRTLTASSERGASIALTMFLFCPHLGEWAGLTMISFRIELWDDADRHVEELIALSRRLHHRTDRI
jgi:hypothetical protein